MGDRDAPRDDDEPSSSAKPPVAISSLKRRGGCGTVGLCLFFSVFAAFGAVFLYFFFVQPLLKIQNAVGWPAVPCTILSSAVATHNGSKGERTYSVEVRYAYDLPSGVRHESTQYAFATGSSSGYDAKAAVVARLRPGSTTTCFVNPFDADEAVLERGMTAEVWFGLFPALFLLIGLGGIIGVTVAARRRARRAPTAISESAGRESFACIPQVADERASMTLTTQSSRVGLLITSLCVTAFWNGIVAVFVFGELLPSWRKGQTEWMLGVFLIPFVLIGLVMVLWVLRNLLGLSNPRPILTLGRGAYHPGESVEIDWEFSGRASAIRRLRIAIEGREQATYRRGTRSVTDQHVFTVLPLIESSDPDDIRAGRARATIPADTMHSFKAANNQVTWRIMLHGDIPRWPDISEEFPLIILPHPPNGARA